MKIEKDKIGTCIDMPYSLYQDLFTLWRYIRLTYDKKIRFQDFLLTCLETGFDVAKCAVKDGVLDESDCE